MPHNTSKTNYKVSIFKLVDYDPEAYNFNEVVKLNFMMLDARLMMPEYDTDGEITVVDVSGFSLKHFFKVVASFSTLKMYLKYVQEAAPIRIVQIHFINCSSIIDKVMALVKPFIKKELLDVIHFHQPNSTALFNFVSRNDLPKDFGGTRETSNEFFREWVAKVQEKK
jgi:hypothetical protein